MKTFTAVILGALLALSINISVRAQSAVVIETGPRAKAKVQTETKVGEKKAVKWLALSSEDGQNRVIEIDGSQKDVQMIDLGDGRKAMITIQTEKTPGAKSSTISIQADADGEDCESCEECEIEPQGQTRAMMLDGKSFAMSFGDDEAGEDCESCEDDDCCDDIEIELGGLAPMIGQLMEHIDLSTVGPMIGALLGEEGMDLDIDFEDGKLEIDGKGIHDLLAKHMGHGAGGDVQRLLAQHLMQGQAHGNAPEARFEITIDDDNCECECECPCCQAGKCAEPKGPAMGRSAPAVRGHVVAPRGALQWQGPVAAPIIRQRRIKVEGEPKTFRLHRHDGAEGARIQAPRVATIEPRHPRVLATPVAPTRAARPAQRGGDLGDIENRIDRLAEEMRALQGELRALRRKI